MRQSLVARLTILEAQHKTALRAWLQSLSEHEFAILVDETYGEGTWQWLCATADTLPLEEIERPGYLWGLYEQWRETQL